MPIQGYPANNAQRGAYPESGARYGGYPGGGSPPAPSFPISSTGLVALISTWYGDDTTHLTTSGTSKVTQFVNQASLVAWANANAAEQASWEADSLAGSMNGFPSIHPDAGDFYLNTEAALIALATGNSPRTIYMVVAPDVAAAFGVVFSIAGSGSAVNYQAYGIDSGGRIWQNVNGGGAANATGTTVLANAQPYVIAFRNDGALAAGWLNAVSEYSAVAQNTGALVGPNRVGFLSRARSTNDLKFDGRAGELLVYNVAHSDAEVVAQSQQLFDRWQLDYAMVITLGDSISRGFGTVSGEFLSDRMPLATKWQRYNGASNGYMTSDVLTVFAARVTARKRWAAARDIVHVWIGTNDITLTNDSAATIYGRITTIIDQAQALGYKVAVSTVLLRSDARMRLDGTTPANPAILDLNTLILANAAGAEVVYDAYNALNVVAGAEANTAPNLYYSDDTHLTDLASDLLAAGQSAAILSIP